MFLEAAPAYFDYVSKVSKGRKAGRRGRDGGRVERKMDRSLI